MHDHYVKSVLHRQLVGDQGRLLSPTPDPSQDFRSQVAKSAKVSINQGCRDFPAAFEVRRVLRKAGDCMGGRIGIGSRTTRPNSETKTMKRSQPRRLTITEPMKRSQPHRLTITKMMKRSQSHRSTGAKSAKRSHNYEVWEKFAGYTGIMDGCILSRFFRLAPWVVSGGKRRHDCAESIDYPEPNFFGDTSNARWNVCAENNDFADQGIYPGRLAALGAAPHSAATYPDRRDEGGVGSGSSRTVRPSISPHFMTGY